jgi:hypothetical protein
MAPTATMEYLTSSPKALTASMAAVASCMSCPSVIKTATFLTLSACETRDATDWTVERLDPALTTQEVTPDSCSAVGSAPKVSACTKSSLSNSPEYRADRLINLFLANLASSTKATIFSNLKADSSSFKKLKMVWSVRSLLLTHPDTRQVPSRSERAATGSGAFK